MTMKKDNIKCLEAEGERPAYKEKVSRLVKVI